MQERTFNKMLPLRYVFTIFYLCGYGGYISGCPTGCTSCSSLVQCEICMAGFWLHDNYCSTCPWDCLECTNSTTCTKCKANYWNTTNNCFSTCKGNCDENGCDDGTGYCYQCKSGYYGTYCRQICELCKNQSCSLRQCTDGCIDGHYELTSGDTIKCRNCYKNCVVCEDYDHCLECNRGFYKFNYNTSIGILNTYCLQCLLKCEECSDYYTCTVCKPGRYGSRCENTCKLSNCYRCTGSGDIQTCTECEAGYKLNEKECVPCESINGICSDECTGYWGEHCNKTCHEGCASCYQTNGYCDLCHRNRYGESCQFTCSEHCSDDGNILHVCSNKTGKCELGCDNGYRGDRCQIALTTHSSAMSKKTTTITAADATATTTATAAPTTAKESDITEKLVESSQLQTGLIAGTAAGGGALVLAVVVVVIVCVVRKRKKQSKDEPQATDVDDRQPKTDTGYTKKTAETED